MVSPKTPYRRPSCDFFCQRRPDNIGPLTRKFSCNIKRVLPSFITFALLMQGNKEIVLSGIRPTGFVHLGNYIGAIRNWVNMQEIYNCYFCIVDWHSLTTHPDTKALRDNTFRMISELIGSGLD